MESGEPPFIIVYGDSGTGKTTDMGYSFPGAVFAAAPGALTSIRSTCGYSPKRVEAKTIMDLRKGLAGWAKNYRWLVVDDFSMIADQTGFALQDSNGYRDARQKYGALAEEALRLRNEARYLGIGVALNCWSTNARDIWDTDARGNKLKKTNFIKGGPQLPGQKLAEAFPGACDLVLRVAHQPLRRPWPQVYVCGPDKDWVQKDRFNVLGPESPMNIAEILRFAASQGFLNYPVPRLAGAESQEEKVAQIAEALVKSGPAQDQAIANTVYQQLRGNGTSQECLVARWTVRDAIDRAHLTRAYQAKQQSYF